MEYDAALRPVSRVRPDGTRTDWRYRPDGTEDKSGPNQERFHTGLDWSLRKNV